MTDQSTPAGRTDLLTPEEVKRELADAEAAIQLELGGDLVQVAIKQIADLCRDYLTLWDRNKGLEAILNARETLGDLLK